VSGRSGAKALVEGRLGLIKIEPVGAQGDESCADRPESSTATALADLSRFVGRNRDDDVGEASRARARR